MRVVLSRANMKYFAVGACALIGALFVIIATVSPRPEALAQNASVKPLESPPEGQTYTGAKQCASCHFDEFLKWRQDKHSKAFDILPAKYKQDAECLKCHTTGYGHETGYKGASTPDLVGTSCEACHGPGSKHGEIAKSFGNKKLTTEEEDYVRSTIHKSLPGNACIECHSTKGHKEHPKYEK